MQLKPIAVTLCAIAFAASTLSASAARFGDENDLSWLPMGKPVKDKMAKMAKEKNLCLNAVRWGDENNLTWLMKAGPCMEGDTVMGSKGMTISGASMVRFGDENDASWLPMSAKDKAMMKKMAAGPKGMCMRAARFGDENDTSWLVRMVDC